MRFRVGAASVALAAMGSVASQTAYCQLSAAIRYDLPSQDLAASLRTVARMSGRDIIISTEAMEGKRAPELHGSFLPDDAVRHLMNGSGVIVRFTRDAILVGTVAEGRPSAQSLGEYASDIVVTGSRIRGTPPASPVLKIDQTALQDGGYHDLGEAVRDLPQAFGGGQNPGVTNGTYPDGTSNLNSASTLNLRGLGSDATLTLVNGHRIAFGGSNQAIDISAIPIEMVDRIEVLTDGASAIYGSDAVGGVANVILKRDYDGFAASAGLGGSTEGGNFQQQYAAAAGSRWSTGGFVAAYEFSRNSAIMADQRSYTSKLDRTTTLLPFRKAHSAAMSAHQMLGETIELSLDGFYNFRRHLVTTPFSVTAPYTFRGSKATARTTTWGIVPSLKYSGLAGWEIGANFSYGKSRARYSTIVASAGANLYDTHGCYCSTLTAFEVNADGTLFTLPGGSAKLALGAGYRNNLLDYSRERTNFRPITTRPQYFTGKQESIYAFGELYLPVIAAVEEAATRPMLGLTAALRYEDYEGMEAVATPKVGLVFAPSRDVDLAATWGRSFKAPTLYQKYLAQQTYLEDADGYGTGYPAGATVLSRGGGNLDLQPERATSWTATLDLHPHTVPGLNITISAFHIRYGDRVVQPILSSAGILDNGSFSDLIILSPSADQISGVVAAAASGLTNLSSYDFDPDAVVAIVDNRYVNVAEQKIRGVDLSARYRVALGGEDSLTFQAAASYIESRQRLTADQPSTRLAGAIFYPPHWRARGGVTWKSSRLGVSGFVNYIGDVSDERFAPAISTIRGQTLVDLTVRYDLPDDLGPLSGLEIQASARNLFNDKPSAVRTLAPYFPPFDSSNYTAIGRFLSLQLTKRW